MHIVVCVSSGEELLQKISELSIINFAILDIELPEISGIELIGPLKSHFPHIVTVFTTGHPQYIQDAFKVQGDQYLLKPVKSRKLFAVLKSLQHRYYTSHIQYVENERRLITIAYSDIVYAEFYRNLMTAHTADSEYTMEVAPKEMKQTLLKRGFIRAHQGFYVNPAHIKAIEHEIVICTNDMEVPVSHRERKNLIRRYTEKYASMIYKV